MVSHPRLPVSDLISSLPPELCHHLTRHLATCSDIVHIAQTSRRNWRAFSEFAYKKAAATLPHACLLVHWAAFRGFTRVIEAAYHAGIAIDVNLEVPHNSAAKSWDTASFMRLDKRALQKLKDQLCWYGSGSPLHVAAVAGRLDVVKQLLGYGADLSSRSCHVCSCSRPDWDVAEGLGYWGSYDIFLRHGHPDWWTPLHVALCTGQAEVAMFLLSQHPPHMSASPENMSTPLHAACISGNIELVQWLYTTGRIADVDAQDWKDQTPLMYAYYYGHRRCVRYLLSLGADINQTARRGSSDKAQVSILRNALCRNRYSDALELLSLPRLRYDGEEAARDLANNSWHTRPLQDGSSPNGIIRPPDNVAAIVRSLLGRLTADWTGDQRRQKYDEYLGLAAVKGNWRVVQALLQSGADVNSASFADAASQHPQEKQTPLYRAISRAFPRGQTFASDDMLTTVRCLLEGGADPELRFGQREPPALWLISNGYGLGHDDIVIRFARLLIQHGARPQRRSAAEFDIPDNQVLVSPLDYIVYGNSMEDFELALKACGDPRALSDDDVVGLWKASTISRRGRGEKFERILELDERGAVARLAANPVNDLLCTTPIPKEALRKLLHQGAAVDIIQHELMGIIRKGLDTSLVEGLLANMPGGSRSHTTKLVALQWSLCSPWWRRIRDKVGIVCAFLDHGVSAYEASPSPLLPPWCSKASLLAQAILNNDDCHPVVDAMLERQPLRDQQDENALDYIRSAIAKTDPHILGRLLASMQDPKSVIEPIREQLSLSLLQQVQDADARERIRTVGDALRIVECLELLFRYGGQPDFTTTSYNQVDSSAQEVDVHMLGKTILELTDLQACGRLNSWKMGLTWVLNSTMLWSGRGEVVFKKEPFFSVDEYDDSSIDTTDFLWDLPWVIEETRKDYSNAFFDERFACNPFAFE